MALNPQLMALVEAARAKHVIAEFTEINGILARADSLTDLATGIATLTHGDVEALGGLVSQMAEADGDALRKNLRLLTDALGQTQPA